VDKAGFETIDEYIAQSRPELQAILRKLRKTIAAAAPGASEKIAYQMPTFFLHGNLVHFAAFRHHIGFYPAPSGVTSFESELTPYKRAKGSIQFPLDRGIPYDLVRRIVEFRVGENLAKEAARKAGKRKA